MPMVRNEALMKRRGLEVRTICGGFLDMTISGRAFGSCAIRPIKDRSDEGVANKERLEFHRQILGASSLLAMNPNSTRTVVSLSTPKTDFLGPSLCVCKDQCDAIVRLPKHSTMTDGRGMFLETADALVVAFADPSISSCWGMMRVGLNCLVSASPTSDIVEVALRAVAHDHNIGENGLARLKFFVGFGVGPCCLGYSEGSMSWTLVRNQAREGFGKGAKVVNSEHLGKPSIDLRRIIFRRLYQYVPAANIEIDEVCTSCAGALDGGNLGEEGKYFSHLRQAMRGEDYPRGRNGIGLFRPSSTD